MKEILTEKVLKEYNIAMHGLLHKHFMLFTQNPYELLGKWLDIYILETDKFIKRIKLIDEKKDKTRILLEHIGYRKSILLQLDNWVNQRIKFDANVIFSPFDKELEEFLHTQAPYWIKKQARERFTRLENDPYKVVFIKFIKRVGYSLSAFPDHIINFFRKLLRKPPKAIPSWTQLIPVKKISHWYYENHFLLQYSKFNQEIYKNTALQANEFWEIDHRFFGIFIEFIDGTLNNSELQDAWNQHVKLELKEIKEKILGFSQGTKDDFDLILENVDSKFQSQLDIAGTLEFRTFKHLEWKRKRGYNKIRKDYTSALNNRYNTLYALADDWKFNQEIYILKSNAFKTNLQFHSRMGSRAKILIKGMERIPVLLQNTLLEIKDADREELRKNLLQLKYNTGKSLNMQIIPELSDLLLEQGFPLVIDETEQSLVNELLAMSSKRILIDGFDPAKGYTDKAMQSITPFELVDFEMMDALRKILLIFKIQTIEKLEEVKTELDSVGRMVVFNLDSAVALLDEHGDNGVEDSLLDARASLQRAIQNFSEFKGLLDKYFQNLLEEFSTATKTFAVQLNFLTDNSKVADIRYRVTRAKALKKSEQIAVIVKNYFLNSISAIRKLNSQTQKKLNSGIKLIKDQLGIHYISDNISMEISDYLISGDVSVLKLPFVYRRLFINEPLKETTFYLLRSEEFGKLDNAYNKWKQGSFAPVLIFGEKGSGVSTFVHLYVKEKIKQNPVVYSVTPNKRVQTEEDLLALLGMSFKAEVFGKIHDLYEFVEKKEPFVAYVDKIQLFYLRQPGGFAVLKKFFEIISNTSRKVFWVCTCGLYGSQYLDKSVGLYDYFPVLILMKNLSKEQVRKVIMLRHKTSGYDLYFKPSHNDLTDSAFLRKNQTQKQEFLREKYFGILNRLTQSNIAFALQLWLRSAEKADDNRILLNSLENIDFSFMFNLPGEVVFGLHAIILHERLDVFQLSQVLSISRRQAYLLLMRLADRGIIVEEKGQYSIHHLLYRQTIMLLKDRNLIH